jgi:hypothetical protein
MILTMAAAALLVGTTILVWIGRRLRGGLFGVIYAVVFGCIAAYAVQFAAEIQLLQSFGKIPSNQPWPVITWSSVGLAAIIVAGNASPSGLPVAIPCAIFSILAMQYGVRLSQPASTYAGVATAFIGVACLLVPRRQASHGQFINDSAIPVFVSIATSALFLVLAALALYGALDTDWWIAIRIGCGVVAAWLSLVAWRDMTRCVRMLRNAFDKSESADTGDAS